MGIPYRTPRRSVPRFSVLGRRQPLRGRRILPSLAFLVAFGMATLHQAPDHQHDTVLVLRARQTYFHQCPRICGDYHLVRCINRQSRCTRKHRHPVPSSSKLVRQYNLFGLDLARESFFRQRESTGPYPLRLNDKFTTCPSFTSHQR